MSDIRILNLFESFAETSPDSQALIGINGQAFTYRHLINIISSLTGCLTARGVNPKQRIAVVVPNALDMAVSYLAVSNVASFTPLRSDYSLEQYKYYFKLLKADALLVPSDYEPALAELAEKMKIPVYSLYKDKTNSEWTYQIIGGTENDRSDSVNLAKNDDIAAINYTSGTTSTPKIVPRSHKNVYSGVMKRLKEVSLNEKDRVLIITPMDRSVSLNMLLTALGSGGCAICAGSFEPGRFFHILQNMHPTWFAVSPVVLQSIIDHAEKNKISIIETSLRFIRSSGAPLSEIQAQKIKNIFNVPVYINYGLTETGNISSTKDSPKGHKPGSVGAPANIDLLIMNENGEPLGTNQVGEIAVRGPQIIKRYDNDEEVNRASFYGDWFRTGDAGYLDEDGYLFITGRFKEIINRGGEKVSPYEVEEAISQHPDVRHAAVFPIPNPEGNEDVGAAIVLKEGKSLYLKDLRRFLNGKIVAFKMPVKIYVMEEIPSSEAGKIQRKKLYEIISSLNISPQPETDMNEVMLLPRSETEDKLYKIFKKILPIKKIDIRDTFFELGGDSLRAAMLFNEIKKAFRLQVPLKHILNNGTIEALASYIDGNPTSNRLYPFLVPFNEEGSKTPIIFVHSVRGTSVVYNHVAKNFDPDRPFYGIDFDPEAAEWEHPITLEQMAAHYIKDIRAVQPKGPYLLAGLCLGGVIAYEIARQLRDSGEEIGFLGLFDSIINADPNTSGRRERMKFTRIIRRRGIKIFIKTKIYQSRIFILDLLYKNSPGSLKHFFFNIMDNDSIIKSARKGYELKKFNGELVFFKPDDRLEKIKSEKSIIEWKKYAEKVRIVNIKGDHDSVFYEENAENTKQVLEKLLSDIL